MEKPIKNKLKKPTVISPADSAHVATTGGYQIVVAKGSAYHKQAGSMGAVLNSLRPGGDKTKEDDPLAVANYNKRYKK